MTDQQLPFPHATRRQLTDPPIELIIAQIRFPTLAALFANDGYVDFADAIANTFPNASPEHHMEVSIGPEGVSSGSRNPVWKFEDLEGQRTLTLTPAFLALETKQYHSFTAFRDSLLDTWQTLIDCHSIQNRTRIGLRYVDRVYKGKYPALPEDWVSQINPAAFPLLSRMPRSPQRSEVEHRFQIGLDLGLTYRSQLTVSEFGDSEEDTFALDLDAFDPTKGPSQDLVARLDVLKETSHNAFWWTLGSLFDLLDPPGNT